MKQQYLSSLLNPLKTNAIVLDATPAWVDPNSTSLKLCVKTSYEEDKHQKVSHQIITIQTKKNCFLLKCCLFNNTKVYQIKDGRLLINGTPLQQDDSRIIEVEKDPTSQVEDNGEYFEKRTPFQFTQQQQQTNDPTSFANYESI